MFSAISYITKLFISFLDPQETDYTEWQPKPRMSLLLLDSRPPWVPAVTAQLMMTNAPLYADCLACRLL